MSSRNRETASSARRVAVLTGGGDRPYALGLASALVAEGFEIDFIASDDLRSPDVCHNPRVRFLNLRGDQRPDVPLAAKIDRIVRYYLRLIRYAARAEPAVFHILWNNKLELLDRTALLLYYRLLGKRLVLTVHNVNVRKRDGHDTSLNRLTLSMQYRLIDHLFVHTPRMKRELMEEFAVPEAKVSVIPFGINSTVPLTALTGAEARQRLGLRERDKVVLFFGNIAPYKGLEHLVEAMSSVARRIPECRLVIAGRPKGSELYWAAIEDRLSALQLDDCVLRRIEYVPDAETEVYFKAADVLVLPYTSVFQSGVLFLAYNFGLPVVATDVASLAEDVIENETGFICRPADPIDLAKTINRYFDSNLYRTLSTCRAAIRSYAANRYSWAEVGAITREVYRRLLETAPSRM